MEILEIINKKEKGKELTKEEIEYFVKEYTIGNIEDDIAAKMIRALYNNEMTAKETTDLTLAMAYSGDVLDLSELGIVVDKHSSGGVGDKVTIILMPIMAAMGVSVAKMSGRGLGFTGGTADKLEAIPGYKTDLSVDEFINNVKEIGISLITQTGNLAPADKKIYALRNEISCTDNISLIASSIMSKKIAAGANKVVLDVTCGSGAFMKNIEEATALSKLMKEIGKLANKETVCVITNMEEPLGYSVGNTLEIIEAIECLKGIMQEDVKEVVFTLGSYILKLAGKGNNIEENKQRMQECISTGKAYKKFLQLVEKQGGDIEFCKNTEKFKMAKFRENIVANKTGNIQKIDAEGVGKIACSLGAGRVKKEDKIDMSAGVLLNYKVGDFVKSGEIIASIYSDSKEKLLKAKNEFEEIVLISNKQVEKPKMILEII